MDNDDQLLEEAREAVKEVDIRYKAADLAGKLELKAPRDQLFSTFADARLELLEDEVLATSDDVAQMQAIRAEIHAAADNQLLAGAAIKAAQLLSGFVPA